MILEPRYHQGSDHPGIQLHCGGAPYLKPDIIPVENNEEWADRLKPNAETGLWTSTYRRSSQDSAWIDYVRYMYSDCLYGEHMLKRTRFLLAPKEDVHLYIVSTSYEFVRLLHDFPYLTKRSRTGIVRKYSATEMGNSINEFPNGIIAHQSIDFEKLAQSYDGLWLTQEGVDLMREWRKQIPLAVPDMQSWSCESIVWFRWCFSGVRILPQEEVSYAEAY